MTPPRIVVSSEARSDIIDATLWYERQRPGWGDVFANAIDATIERVARSPEAYPIVEDAARRAIVKRFPFSVYYILEAERIAILAVIHASRDPETWSSRRGA